MVNEGTESLVTVDLGSLSFSFSQSRESTTTGKGASFWLSLCDVIRYTFLMSASEAKVQGSSIYSAGWWLLELESFSGILAWLFFPLNGFLLQVSMK